MKKYLKVFISLVIIFLSFFVTSLHAETYTSNLNIYLNRITTYNSKVELIIKAENDGSFTYLLDTTTEVVVKTNENEYKTNVEKTIGLGTSSIKVTIKDYKGTLESIKIKNLKVDGVNDVINYSVDTTNYSTRWGYYNWIIIIICIILIVVIAMFRYKKVLKARKLEQIKKESKYNKA